MKKLIASITMAALLGGGAVALSAALPTSFAGAQEAPAGASPSGPGLILQKALDKLVAKGTLTQEQADAVQAAVREEAGAAGIGPNARRRELVQKAFAVAGETIGVDAATLEQDVRAGQSVAEVAQANGVDPQTVIDAIVAAGTAAIEQGVTDGRIPEQAAAMLEQKLPAGAARFVQFAPPAG